MGKNAGGTRDSARGLVEKLRKGVDNVGILHWQEDFPAHHPSRVSCERAGYV
jgi:hypothetical protein